MKLRFDDDVEAFRAEFVAFLEAHRPSLEDMAAEPSLSTGHMPGWLRRWTRTLFDHGWLVPGWPPELGGRNAGPIETLVYMEELTRHRVPRHANVQGLAIIAPSIIDYGTPEQVEEYAMPILRGERTACLGMSEPGAGSDLAALSCKAVLEGDEWVISGQKVWTSGANYADFCFLFCRTDPTATKHKGISIVLVPMDAPGITVRPLPEIVHPDEPDLNEVFLDEVRVPAGNLVGELNNGWAMANGSLAHERGMVWVTAVMGLEAAVARLLELAPSYVAPMGPTERALAIDEIVGIAIDTEAARCLGYRGFAKLARGGTAPEQALMKLYASDCRQQVARIAAEVQGADALGIGAIPNDGQLAVDEPRGTWLEQYFQSFANTISAGTSEIQRNIIAERVLGLPAAERQDGGVSSLRLKFHVTHPLITHPYHPDLVTGEGVVRLARAAEVAGFDGYGFTDHPAPTQAWLDAGGHDALDPFVALGFVAAATERIRLIPNIVVLPYRNPFVVAKAAATLDALSGGRFTLAAGVGYLEGEYEALGVSHADRAALFDEALDVLVKVWTEDSVSVEGRGFRAEGITAHPRPASRPPIWVGGNSAAARRRVAERGDGWCPFPAPKGMASFVGTAPLDGGELLEAGIADLHRRLEAVGRDPATVDIAFTCKVGGNPAKDDFNVDEHLEGLARLAELGVTWIQVGIPGDSPAHAEETLARYGQLVLGGRAV